MDTEKMCKLFLEGDSYFNDENVDTEKINEKLTIKGYCRDNSCKTNGESINALAAYIYMKFKDSISRKESHNDYDEYLLMWISDKLFKIHIESIGKKNIKGYIDAFTLKKAYEEYLEKHKQVLDYWELLNMMQGLKEANLKYMIEFYKLLNNICITIAYYNDKGAKSSQLSKYSKNCLTQYRTLYKNISECNSYLDLLNKLKGVYDDFRDSAITKTDSENKLATNLQTLTTEDGKEMGAVRGFKTYNFSDSKCKVKKKSASPPLQPTKLESTSSSLPLTPSPEMQKQDSPPPSQSPEQPKDHSSEQKDSGSDTENQKDSQSDSKDHEQTMVTDKKGSDDGVVGGSEDSNGGQNAINIVPEASSLGILNAATYLVNATPSFETINKRITETTDTIKNFYSTALSNLETTYGKYISVLKEMIDNISTDSKEVEPPAESGGGGDGASQPQKNSEQTSSETSPSSTDQTQEHQSSQEPSENQNSDKSDQESEKPVEVPVVKSENPGTETKGNGTIGIGDIFIFKEFKKIGIPIIVIIISITLAIMYKFLVFERRKKLKRKKMKKSTNLFGVNKTT
ncbi:PIR protein CIR protein [Plasmodium vinckei vinckei]|uniref:PIR protein CIR protein n=1 Tax=Plasmodium vinckei vinckei TaxID=54757 RepID=A0A449BPS9_PLAVN|nr:PIR protein CIR protein [Plasmodium vinckei vinckei]VEV55379.1 PIR protein CIR protein [Plasmodium vinckei vinckei]